MGRLVICLLFGVVFLGDLGCARLMRRHHDRVEVQLNSEPSPQNTAQAIHLTEKASRLIEHGKLEHAEKRLNEAIQLDPTLGMAHNNLGMVFYQRRQLYDAAHSYQRAIELMPGDPIPYNNLGMTWEQGDRINDAVMCFQEAHLLQPQNPVFLGNLVRAKLRRGDSDTSLDFMLKELVFLETRPDWVEWARQELCINLPRIKGDPDPEVCTTCETSGSMGTNSEPVLAPTPEQDLPDIPPPGKIRLPSPAADPRRNEMNGSSEFNSIPVPVPGIP